METRPVCTRPWKCFRVENTKGYVKPCCYTHAVCGNINHQTPEAIWNGEMYQDLRSRMVSGRIRGICPFDCPILLGERDSEFEYASEQAQSNHRLQLEEIRRGALRLSSHPTYWRVTPTVACNLRCSFCYQNRHDTVELPSNMDALIDAQLPFLGELEIVGGEPFISPECLRIMARMDRHRFPDLHLAVITNGTAITESVIATLSECRISWILVSVDAATAATYARVRGANFDTVVSGVRRLQALRAKSKEEWKLRLNFTVMRSNMHEAVLFPEFAGSFGADFQFTPVHGVSHPECYYHLPAEVKRAQDILESAQQTLERNGTHDHGIKRTRLVLEYAAPRGVWR